MPYAVDAVTQVWALAVAKPWDADLDLEVLNLGNSNAKVDVNANAVGVGVGVAEGNATTGQFVCLFVCF